jgi:protein phosphatase
VYGIQYEYAKALKQLHAESRELFSTKNFDAQKTPEIDETTEVLIRDGGFYQMTRAQARSHVEVPFGEVLDVSECQDTVLYKPSKGLFGVFDGVGGSENGRGASRRAADVISQISESSDLASGSNLAWAINEANNAILRDPELCGRGQTTGVVAKITEQNGKKMLSYATVGDSRLYRIDKDNNVEMITMDEGEGRYITNAIGDPRCEIKQFGDIPLNTGDRFLLCSDGITGDKPEEMMSGAQIAAIMRASKNDFEAAHNLMMAAKKGDDRTAVVFTPEI